MGNEADKALAALAALMGGEFVEHAKTERIPSTMYALGGAIGGGWPRGRLVHAYGPSDSGKTTLAIEVASDVLKAGGSVLWLDYECALDLDYAQRVTGKAWRYCPTIQTLRKSWQKNTACVIPPPTLEAGAKLADVMARTGEVDLLIHDSIAAMVVASEQEESADGGRIPELARKLARWLPRHKAVASRSGTLSWFINHAKKSTIGYSGPPQYAPWVTLGGAAPNFYSDVRLLITGKRPPTKSVHREGGRIMKISVKRNKTSKHRGADLEYTITGLDGVDRVGSSVQAACECGALERRKGRFLYDGRLVDQPTIVKWLANDDHGLTTAIREFHCETV